MSKPGATIAVTDEEARKARRAMYDPANLSEERKITLVRRLAVTCVAGGMNSAYTDFTDKMVNHYDWTPREARMFLFSQSQRLEKAWRTLGDWTDGYGEITFSD